MMLVYDAGSLVFVWEGERMRMILHTPDVRSIGGEPVQSTILTTAELKLLPHLVDGLSNVEIASAVGCSSSVVHFHLANIMRKLGARNRVAVAVHCVREGLVA